METNNIIFTIVIVIFIVLFAGASYFILSDKVLSNNANNITKNTLKFETGNANEVFHLRDNIYSYDEAKAACKAYNSRLASINEVIDAYKQGANWCSYGWSDGQMALFPTQKDFWEKLQSDPMRKHECGVPGVNGGYFENKNYQFGVNCYGEKPCAKGSEIQKDKESYNHEAEKYKGLISEGSLKVAPFNESRWFQ